MDSKILHQQDLLLLKELSQYMQLKQLKKKPFVD